MYEHIKENIKKKNKNNNKNYNMWQWIMVAGEKKKWNVTSGKGDILMWEKKNDTCTC